MRSSVAHSAGVSASSITAAQQLAYWGTSVVAKLMRLVVAVEGAGPVRNVGGMATGAGVEEDMVVVVVGGGRP